MSLKDFNDNSYYVDKLIEAARKEVHDSWSNTNTPQHKRLLKQLHDIENASKNRNKLSHTMINFLNITVSKYVHNYYND